MDDVREDGPDEGSDTLESLADDEITGREESAPWGAGDGDADDTDADADDQDADADDA